MSPLRLFSSEPEFRVHICFGPNCTPRGSRDLLPLLHDALLEAGISEKVEVLSTSCRNRCEFGPSVNVYPGNHFYAHVDPEGLIEIVIEHLMGGRPVERLRYRDPAETEPTKRISNREARWRS